MSTRIRWQFMGVVAATAAISLVASPAMAQAADPVSGLALINTTEDIGPGISLNHVKSVDQRGWVDAQFLTIDLSNSVVSTDLLTSGPVASGGPLSVSANKAGAVAGVNGEFFDIGNSNAALGGEIQDGRLIKTADTGGRQHVGVSQDGIAQLVDLAVDATATFAGAPHKVLAINAANGSGVPANGLVAYTSDWGTYSRNRGFTGVANADLAEVFVQNEKVVSVTATGPAGSGEIPADGFYLVGRDAAAVALRALQPGDALTLDYELTDELAKTMKFALGEGGTIVRDGQVVPGLDRSIAPRTALGFKDGGRTLVLATWDGPGGTGKGGIGIDREAADLVARGIETAVNLDGGGSTTMVARALGEDAVTVRNVPSDGQERNDPNGVGVFVAPGDGKVHTVLVSGAAGAASADGGVKVFPGMHRALTVKAVDDHGTPVAVAPESVRWQSQGGPIKNGVLTAPGGLRGAISVRATVAGTVGTQEVSVLGRLASLELSSSRLSIAEAKPESAVTVAVTGRDDQGYTAPIDPQDLTLDYDHDVVDVQAQGGKLKIVPLTDAGTILTISAAGQTVKLPITIGVQSKLVYDFDDDVTAHWSNNSTAATTRAPAPEGLQITFSGMRNVGITANGAANRLDVPGQPLRIKLRLKTSIDIALPWINVLDAAGKNLGIFAPAVPASPDFQYATYTLPPNTVFPVKITGFQGINTSAAAQKAGTFVLDRFEADVPSSIELPAQPDLVADPLISPDGELAEGNGTWEFATLSDVQFTADNPSLTQVATTAINRIRQENPDLIVLNGDITDRGLPQDLALAHQVLEDAGCDLIAVGAEPAADSTPDPSTGTIPCYYVPGNHESYGVNNSQLPDLSNFTAEFGQPYRTFDHKGTRFVLLASSLGLLRGTNWDQLPMLQQALENAKADPSIDNVLVFAHHPVDDPEATKASQLGDRDEVALVEKLLTDFRTSTGKGAAMFGSHAQVANVHRIEGVPYTVLPSSGKDPYGTPDRGGFTGWVKWSVDSRRNADQQWLEADVRAFAQSITLNAPAQLAAGTATQLSGSIVQPQGVANGSRVVPLRYPMSVHWSGSDELAIGSGADAVAAAKAAGKVAVFDPVTRTLTALREGSVTVTVTNDSMRAFTGPESLAPVTTSKTITVVPAASIALFTAETPVFTNQVVDTEGQVQPVVISNQGTAPLAVSAIGIDGGSGAFTVGQNDCVTTLAPGDACTVAVRFAPTATGTAHAKLTVKTGGKAESVPLMGKGESLTWIPGDDLALPPAD